MLVREPQQSVAHPRWHEVDCVVGGVYEPLALHEVVEVEDVDPFRTGLVGLARDGARQLLLADVRRQSDHLAGLHVGTEADGKCCEASYEVAVIAGRHLQLPVAVAQHGYSLASCGDAVHREIRTADHEVDVDLAGFARPRSASSSTGVR